MYTVAQEAQTGLQNLENLGSLILWAEKRYPQWPWCFNVALVFGFLFDTFGPWFNPPAQS